MDMNMNNNINNMNMNNNMNINQTNMNNDNLNSLDLNGQININNQNDLHQYQIYINLYNKNYQNPPNYVNGLNINNVNISLNNKPILEKLSGITKYSLITPLEIIYKEQYGIFTKTTKEMEKCPICLMEFYDDIIDENTQNLNLKNFDIYIKHEIDTIKLFKCEDHFYHIECLSNYIKNKDNGFKCAVCQKIYGIIIGNMPPGTMKVSINKNIRCAGYPHDETIVIDYSFKNGILDGKHYSGTHRTSYLPNNKEGREVLGMLKIAFDRKLTFVVGTSVTTGKKNTVIWNGIHHKTSIRGGVTNYGYPDPTYFNRVYEELAAKGVNKSDFENGELEGIAYNLIKNGQ